MKKFNLLFSFCFVLLTFVQAQNIPNAFNYSAVARNTSGQAIATTNIGIQISIIKTSPNGTSQYSENHVVTTDAFGLFNLVIGAGSVQSGSMATIDWSNDNYYLKVDMDVNGGTNFITMGTTQLLSVPYALYAKSAGSLGNGETSNLVLPTITTNNISGITSNSATFSGNISNANGTIIIERGVVYSNTPNPYLGSKKIMMGNGVGSFDTILGFSFNYEHWLTPNTTYYVRSYALTDNNLTVYGNEISFTTPSVGQTGPGGGIVFFDKGNNDNGWQYLECSPDEYTSISWGCDNTNIVGVFQTVGSGESNTNLIVAAGCNDVPNAAKLCDELNAGGQSDWFLPSLHELNLIYKNLYSYNIGNFSNGSGIYWSSSGDDYLGYAGNGDGAWSIYFRETPSESRIYGRGNTFRVRAIRAY